jgi:hypothetical protein
LLQAVGDGKSIPEPQQAHKTVDMKRRAKPATSSRKGLLIGGGTLVFVGSLLIAYFAMRKSEKPKPPAVEQSSEADESVIDARVNANPWAAPTDPWTASHDPSRSPITAAPTDPPDGDPPDASVELTLHVVGVPKNYLLYLNGRSTKARSLTVHRGELVKLELWTPDHEKIYKTSSFEAALDGEEIDFGVHQLSECGARDLLCKQIYCTEHGDDPGCPKHDTDMIDPFGR